MKLVLFFAVFLFQPFDARAESFSCSFDYPFFKLLVSVEKGEILEIDADAEYAYAAEIFKEGEDWVAHFGQDSQAEPFVLVITKDGVGSDATGETKDPFSAMVWMGESLPQLGGCVIIEEPKARETL